MSSPECLLPKALLERASLRGNEYAWRVADIPEVIRAAREAGLVNIGGQLQFRIPEGGTCECYWVEVDTYKPVFKALSWGERVQKTADVVLADFVRLTSEYDFLKGGERAFSDQLGEVKERGVTPAETMYFVWYVADAESTY